MICSISSWGGGCCFRRRRVVVCVDCGGRGWPYNDGTPRKMTRYGHENTIRLMDNCVVDRGNTNVDTCLSGIANQSSYIPWKRRFRPCDEDASFVSKSFESRQG